VNRTVRRPIPLLSRSPGDEGDLDEGAQGAGEDPAGRVVELMPSRRRPDPEPTLSILPGQIHIGDCFTDAETGDEPHEWEVVSRPVTFKKGHEVRARVQRPGDPGTAREKYWAAHEKITVRRRTAALSRPTAEIEDDVADVHTLRRELRRLRAEVLRLEEDKRVLEERVRFPRARAGGDAEEVPAGHVNLVERDGSAGIPAT